MPHIVIQKELCKGCGLCVEACPKECIRLADEVNVKGYNPAVFVAPDNCTGCANCGVICPDAVIEVFREVKAK